MNSIETRILDYGRKIDMNLQNISEQINQIQKLIGEIPLDARLVKEYDDEDDEDEFDDGVWIEFPFRETT
ncbi:hypothetical protein [Rickettsia endosymbiont of Nabis limbatus]|uniref:hypothetical protein n=1 Tax=Rickettsia endosymbiont of Nabis limbatus TaxID=3066268 RepID=UPI003AF336BA